MTIEPISLSELKAKRAAMDRGPWSFDTPEPPAGSVDIQGAECRCDDKDETIDPWSPDPSGVMCPTHDHIAEWVTMPNAVGIVATHNAADALLEVTDAALAWKLAIDERKDFGDRAYRADPFSITTPAHRAGVVELDKQIGDRVVALQLALAKVKP